MRKSFIFLISTLTLAVLISSLSFGQADTVIVPQSIDGNPYGAMNKFILGDTTATGDRINPDRTYKLERNKIYFLSGTLFANFDLRLIADAPDANNRPAIVTSGIGPDGGTVGFYIQCLGDATFKNIYFQATPPTSQGETFLTIQLLKDEGNYLFDGVHFEWGLWLSVGVWASNTKTTIINSYFRNVQNATAEWNGRGISFQNFDQDTVIMVNNTFFNVNSFLLQGQKNLMKYVKFEHNTMVNSVKWPIQWQWQVKADISNNLFYNIHSMGEFPKDKVGQDIDGLEFGIFNMEKLPLLFTDTLGYAETDRIVNLHNNSWFYSQEVLDYWASIDSLSGQPFMNSRTQGMFDGNTAYPSLDEQNTMNLDPNFVTVGGTTEMIQWIKDLRDTTIETSYWGWDPDGDRFGVTWPLPENLSYTNATLLTAANGGYPVGDLNWFPAKKAEWDDWMTDIKETTKGHMPTEYTLSQNYPNPFNPTTEMNFSIPISGNTTLSIYNVLGQKVATLIDKDLSAGSYKYKFDASNLTSGIYFYRLQSNDYSQVKKMMLLK